MIRLTAKTAAAQKKLARIAAATSPEAIDPIVDRAAFITQARLIRSTPKKWFGQVRRGWIVAKPSTGVRVVINQNKVMLFLEEGTKPHGPKEIYGPLVPGQPRKKKALFIPLSRRAVNATSGFFGVGTAIKTTRHTKDAATLERVRAIYQRTESVRKGKRKVGNRALLYGQDYVLAKRVKGIKARHIVSQERPKARAILLRLLKAHLNKAIKGN